MTNTTTQNGKVQTTAVSIAATTIALKSFANIFCPLYFSLSLISEDSDRLDLGREFEGRNNFPMRRSNAGRSRQSPDQDLLDLFHSLTGLLQLIRERRTGISQHTIL
jgi:hypothetical protein